MCNKTFKNFLDGLGFVPSSTVEIGQKGSIAKGTAWKCKIEV